MFALIEAVIKGLQGEGFSAVKQPTYGAHFWEPLLRFDTFLTAKLPPPFLAAANAWNVFMTTVHETT